MKAPYRFYKAVLMHGHKDRTLHVFDDHGALQGTVFQSLGRWYQTGFTELNGLAWTSESAVLQAISTLRGRDVFSPSRASIIEPNKAQTRSYPANDGPEAA